jgi:type IV pilus biogenesis protein CpaD/CtpE
MPTGLFPAHRALTSTALALLAGCASSAGPHTPVAQELTLRPGEQVVLQDRNTLRYVRLLNDSRCPADVQCVWAGDAEVLFAFATASGPTESIALRLTAPSHALGTRWLHLLDLGDGANPAARLRVDETPPTPR